MKEWLEDFYADPALRQTMLEGFLPVFSTYVAEATGGPVAASFVQALAESYIDRHLGSSRAQLQEVIAGDDPLTALAARFDEWEEKRPGKVARNELVRSANAASVQRMREVGVTRKVWRSSGGSCPYCQKMNGRTIEVDRNFLEAGEELTPEGATPMAMTSSVGHPPVHQGCDCSIEAVTEIQTEFDADEFEEAVTDEYEGNFDHAPRARELAELAGMTAEEAERMEEMAVGWNRGTVSAHGIALREAALRRGASAADFLDDPLRRAIIDTAGVQDMVADANRLLDLSVADVQRRFGTDGTITVYRGMHFEAELPGMPAIGQDAIEAVVDQRPLSSWSLNRSEAFRFAEEGRLGGHPVGYVMEMKVPITDVAGVSGTGLGVGSQSEVVLFGRAGRTAQVLRTDPLP